MNVIEFEIYSQSAFEIENHLTKINKLISSDPFTLELNSIYEILENLKSIKNLSQYCGQMNLSKITGNLETLFLTIKINKFTYDSRVKSISLKYIDQAFSAIEESKLSAYHVPSFDNLQNEIQQLIKSTENFYKYFYDSHARDKILLIDDDVDFSNYLKKIIVKEHDIDFTMATDGLNALLYSNDMKFSLIVCDYKLPVLNGIEYIQRIRNNEGPNKSSTILFASAHEPEILETKLWENIYYLKKPIEDKKIINHTNFILRYNKN